MEDSLKQYANNIGISNDITWAGWQDNPFSIMAQSDLFVFTSSYEGFGNVLVEAMACGLPVISTSCPSGPSEILADGKYGVLVPVGDQEAVARATIDLLQNKNKYNTMKRLSLERATDFDVQKIARNYLACMGL